MKFTLLSPLVKIKPPRDEADGKLKAKGPFLFYFFDDFYLRCAVLLMRKRLFSEETLPESVHPRSHWRKIDGPFI